MTYKLYYFNPNTYSATAYVIAESLEKAKEYLLKSKPRDEENPYSVEFHKEHIDNMTNLKNGYTVEEFEVGQVVFGEIS